MPPATPDAPSRTRPTPKPATSVSGSPIPSRRAGIDTSPRNARRSIRAASPKSTSASVDSASSLTASPETLGSTSPSASPPTRRPNAVNTIGPVIGVPSRRPETAAKASSASAIVGSAQSTCRHYCALPGSSPRNRGSRQASVVVELPPVVEIVPSTVPFETVHVEVTVRVPPPGSVHVPVKPVSSSALSVPSQIAPLANRSWRRCRLPHCLPSGGRSGRTTVTRRCR